MIEPAVASSSRVAATVWTGYNGRVPRRNWRDFVVSPNNMAGYSDALVVLGTAGVVVPMVRRWGLSPVLGYLAAGAVLGPLGLGSISKGMPVLSWFTISDAQNVAGIAELGIVFLAVPDRSRTFAAQAVGDAPPGDRSRRLAGHADQRIDCRRRACSRKKSVGSDRARSKPVAVVDCDRARAAFQPGASHHRRWPCELFRFARAGPCRYSDPVCLSPSLPRSPAARFSAVLPARCCRRQWRCMVIVLFGRVLLRPLFRLVATARSTELFIAAVLFVIVAAGVIAEQAGICPWRSAPLLPDCCSRRRNIAKRSKPRWRRSKGLLLGIFFFTVGMNIDFRELVREPLLLLGGVVGLIALKALLSHRARQAFPPVVAGRHRNRSAAWSRRGIRFRRHWHGGELPGSIEPRLASLTLAVTSVTMALTPLLSIGARHLAAATDVGQSRRSANLRRDRRADSGMRSSSAMAASVKSFARS